MSAWVLCRFFCNVGGGILVRMWSDAPTDGYGRHWAARRRDPFRIFGGPIQPRSAIFSHQSEYPGNTLLTFRFWINVMVLESTQIHRHYANVHGKCPWQMSMANVHGKCPWKSHDQMSRKLWSKRCTHVLVGILLPCCATCAGKSTKPAPSNEGLRWFLSTTRLRHFLKKHVLKWTVTWCWSRRCDRQRNEIPRRILLAES